MTDAVAKSELTSLRTKLFYGFGSVAVGIKANGFQTILQLVYNQVIGLPGPLDGLAIASARPYRGPDLGQLSFALGPPSSFHVRIGTPGRCLLFAFVESTTLVARRNVLVPARCCDRGADVYHFL